MSRIITARRQVSNEKDRLGGYGQTDFAEDSVQNLAFGENAFRTTRAERGISDYEVTHPVVMEPADISDPVRYSGYSYEDIGLVPANRFMKKQRDAEELMPRIEGSSRRIFLNGGNPEQTQAPEQKPAEKTQRASKTESAAGKWTLIAYIAAVVMLIAVVIGTGIAINGATERVAVLEAERSAAISALNSQLTELDLYTDSTYMTGKAVEEGFEKITSYVPMEMVALNDPKVYQVERNWFDRLCDWISGLFH